MKAVLPYSKSVVAWLLVIPVVAWFYIGLFLTMTLWYPAGVSAESWQAHLLHFSVVYALWLVVFVSYRLFDWESLRLTQAFFGRLFAALLWCLIIAAVYFYFQPSLLITPRRFLIVHLVITGLGIFLWYWLMRRAVARNRTRSVYVHPSHGAANEVESLISSFQALGLSYSGTLDQANLGITVPIGSIVVIPSRTNINLQDSKSLFDLRNKGIRFVEFYELYENLTRTVHLAVLSDLWFIHSIDYRGHQLFDAVKRVIDITLGLIGTIVFAVSYLLLAPIIKLTSKGPVIFAQKRVGQLGKSFVLYKYRTMTTNSASNTWTVPGDARITTIGKILRALRLDELPQAWNILKGDMSIVGPRPEQVHIVNELEQQIPYYNERHLVKPGLTGWAQLHVYAATLEESKRKLQYDLYYIKHRSLLFDLEIIVKTFYNVITFSGR